MNLKNNLPIIQRAYSHPNSIAFQTPSLTHTYQELLDRSATIAKILLADTEDLNQKRVALLLPTGFEYAAAQWGIWQAGGIKLPLCLSATESEWEYALTDSTTSIVVTDKTMAGKIAPLCNKLSLPFINLDDPHLYSDKPLPYIDPNRNAMILYTSGTTSKPKGVVTSHQMIQAQIESLIEAWEWSPADRIPLFLPMHHIHGIINVLSCALWIGALVEPFPRFDLPTILNKVIKGSYTLFMAVPTIYVKLIQCLKELNLEEQTQVVDGFKKMRLMVSGSAALPASVHHQWTELTNQKLLERYGMTEIGMALSNPYQGERRPGAVGIPLPGVEVRLKSDSGDILSSENLPGEIQVRGKGIFHSYWNRPDASINSFDDGWFRTGDMAVIERGYFRIMGRLSVDIIKSGGYKLSALEIEAVLYEHPDIKECAVVGVQDEVWGEAVAVAVVLEKNTSINLESLRTWSRAKLSVYKIPQRLILLDELPRNAMGKVTKPAIIALF